MGHIGFLLRYCVGVACVGRSDALPSHTGVPSLQLENLQLSRRDHILGRLGVAIRHEVTVWFERIKIVRASVHVNNSAG